MKNNILEDDIDDTGELFETMVLETLDEDEEENDFDCYKEMDSANRYPQRTGWDTRCYNPTEWELYLRELGTNAY